jgi:hypothetical protein
VANCWLMLFGCDGNKKKQVLFPCHRGLASSLTARLRAIGRQKSLGMPTF